MPVDEIKTDENNYSNKRKEIQIVAITKVCNSTSISHKFPKPNGLVQSERNTYVAFLSRKSRDPYIVWT